MKPSLPNLLPRLILCTALALAATCVFSQETENPAATDQAAREKQLQEQLTNVQFVGRWSSVSEEGLGSVREEKYTLQGISKVGGDVWLVHARIQYGDKDATVPVPVKVAWVADTPILHITDLAIPGLGTYTARVVIQNGMYAGTWSGGNHGGVMSGLIQPVKKE